MHLLLISHPSNHENIVEQAGLSITTTRPGELQGHSLLLDDLFRIIRKVQEAELFTENFDPMLFVRHLDILLLFV